MHVPISTVMHGVLVCCVLQLPLHSCQRAAPTRRANSSKPYGNVRECRAAAGAVVAAEGSSCGGDGSSNGSVGQQQRRRLCCLQQRHPL